MATHTWKLKYQVKVQSTVLHADTLATYKERVETVNFMYVLCVSFAFLKQGEKNSCIYLFRKKLDKTDTIMAQEGEFVKAGQVIAKIGNSGNTSEPYLHIHARKENTGGSILDEEGMPIIFDGKFLVRNNLLFPK